MSRSSSRPEWRLAERSDLLWKTFFRATENVWNDFWCDLVDERYEKPEDSLAKTTRKR